MHGHGGTIGAHGHRGNIRATGGSRMVIEVSLEPLVAHTWSQGYHWSHRWLMHGHSGTTGATGGSRMVIKLSLETLVAHV